MTILSNKRGTWLNQYALPDHMVFVRRARQVDYVIIKYGLKDYEVTAAQFGIPWLAERMAENGEGSQDAPQHADQYAQELAAQANQPGCIGAVINLEEADGGWHLDNGWGTIRLIKVFRDLAPGKPIFAALDTRGNRANSPYQRAAAAMCDGVMPMVYPGAFEQSAAVSFAASINELVRAKWAGKEIIPAYQTYGGAEVPSQVWEVTARYRYGIVVGATTYTLGHATEEQWQESLGFATAVPAPPVPPVPNVGDALRRLRELWVVGWHRIEQGGTVGDAASFSAFWRGITGQ